MWSQWLFTAGSIRGVAIRVHFSTLVGLLIACFGAFPAGLVFGYFTIVVLHELGHAVLARAAGARIVGFDLSPIGGVCRWEGSVTPVQRSVIAWGGVAMQLVLLVSVIVLLRRFGFPRYGFLDALAWASVLENGFIMFINLMPVDPLDGVQAWKLFPLLLKRRGRGGRVPLPGAKKQVSDRVLERDEFPDEIKETVATLLAEAARDARSKRSPP